MQQEVAVTGMGVLTAIGEGVPAFTEALRQGRCGVSGEGADGLPVAARLPAIAWEDRLAALRGPAALVERARKAGRQSPRAVQVALVAALEAWSESGLGASGCPRDAINVLVGGNNLSQRIGFRMAEKYRDAPHFVSARHALQFMDTDHVGVISEVLELRGEGNTIGGASASGNAALLHAYRQVAAGECKACVVVAAMADLSPVEGQAFRNLGAMGGSRFAGEPEKACRPFDADREGFILGEGCACLILEPMAEARRRGAPVWGRVAGGALCLDGNRLADPSLEGEVRVMRKALQAAHVGPSAIDYVNAHATSSVLGDQIEAQALKAVFGDDAGRVWVNATKGLIGHCLYAASLVEAAATFVQMKHGFLHPNRNLERPIDAGLRLVGASSQHSVCRAALNNAFGFGGINSCMVLTAE